MTTTIDTNVLVAFWDKDPEVNRIAQTGLDAAMGRGSLVVAAPVYAELLAFPGRSEKFLDEFFRETGITVDWNLSEGVWRAAGAAFQAYSIRRKRGREYGPRRILADFVIGAHALENKFKLLTLDEGVYRTAFPRLELAEI
jgi:predicted nucleic acid-binding protein